MPDLVARYPRAAWLKRSHRPHTYVVLSSLATTATQAAHPATGSAPGHTEAVTAGHGAPPVRGTATIYVGGRAGPPQAKIGRVAGCLFWGIAGADPATRVLESPRTVAFPDINPQAPVHVLVIPRQHRVVSSTGPQAGQTVHHVHAHVLGGRPLAWPPG